MRRGFIEEERHLELRVEGYRDREEEGRGTEGKWWVCKQKNVGREFLNSKGEMGLAQFESALRGKVTEPAHPHPLPPSTHPCCSSCILPLSVQVTWSSNLAHSGSCTFRFPRSPSHYREGEPLLIRACKALRPANTQCDGSIQVEFKYWRGVESTCSEKEMQCFEQET